MSFTSGRRDLTLAIAARAVSLLGDQAALTALTLRLLDRGEPAWTVAALLVAGLAPLVLVAPLAGRLVDRLDSRRLMVGSGLLAAVLCIGLAQVRGLSAVLALVVALGVAAAVLSATGQALLPTLAGPQRLASALGLAQATATAAGIIAPVLGATLTGRFGSRVPLYVDALTYLLVAAAGFAIRQRRRPSPARDDRGGGLAYLWADPSLRVIVSLLGGFAMLGGMVNVVEVYLVRQTLHASATWYGVVGALWGAGMFLGALLGRRVGATRSGRWVFGSAVVLAVSVAAYAVSPSVAGLIPCALIGGAGNGVLNLTASMIVMRRAPEAARGRIAAGVAAVGSAGLIGAYLLGGLLATALTPREIFALAGLVGLAVPLGLRAHLLAADRVAEAVPA